MRMTDETPLVNHSFALPAYVFSGRQNRKRRFEAMNYNCTRQTIKQSAGKSERS